MDIDVKKKIDDVHKEIYGNGNSSNSIVTRIARMESTIKILMSVSLSQFVLLITISLKMFIEG